MTRVPLLALVACLALPQVAGAAYVDVQFRPQNGDLDTATEWAVEMISDTPIGSTGMYIPGVGLYSGFTPWPVTSVVGLPGVEATIHAVYDTQAGWSYPDPWGLPPGLIINAGPGLLAPSLGPVDTYLGMGLLYGVTYSDILAGQYAETGLWADDGGSPIPASDVDYTFHEPTALLLLALGSTALALLRGRRGV